MKKSFALLALVPFVLFSCQKEVAQNDINTVVPTLDNGIPTVITCDINQEATNGTRTQYADNQTFGWTNGDQVRMPVKNGSDQINFFSFTASGANNGDVSAIFYKNQTNENLEPDYDPIGTGWTNLGYLIYPTSIFSFSESQSDGVWNSGNYPVVNLPASYNYSFSNPLDGGFVPMIGRMVGSSYHFSTAVGFIKVTLNSMSAATAKVVLESANNSIAGKFAVSDVPETESIAQILQGSATAGTSSITLNVSSVDAGSNHDFYFPLPVGTYAADDLTIKVLDSSNKVLASKTASKVLNIARNEILELPAITTPYYSVSVSGTASAPTGYFTKQNAVIFFTVTDSEETLARSSYISGMKFSNDGTDSYTLHDHNTGLMNAPSGLKYMHYVVAPYSYSYSGSTCVQVPEADIIEQGKIPFYYLASDDAAAIAGTYNFTSLYALTINNRSAWQDMTSNNSVYVANNYSDSHIKFAVSDDATQGAIMMTDFMGFGSDGVTNKSFTEQVIITDSNHIWDPTGTYDTVSPIYGLYSGNVITLYCENAPLFVLNGVSYYLRRTDNSANLQFEYTSTGEVATMSFGSTYCPPCIVTGSQISAFNTLYKGDTCTILFDAPNYKYSGGHATPIATRNL